VARHALLLGRPERPSNDIDLFRRIKNNLLDAILLADGVTKGWLAGIETTPLHILFSCKTVFVTTAFSYRELPSA